MLKFLWRFLLLVGGLVACWLGFSKVDWVGSLGLRRTGSAIERKVGDVVWGFVERTERVERSRDLVVPVDALVRHLCRSANLTRCPLRIAIIRNRDVNAFALPGQRILITTGLLREVQTEAELAGVLAHELSHVEAGHAMQALINEFGLAVLQGLAGGGAAGTLSDVVTTLSSSAHSQSVEADADRQAVDYLVAARVDPSALADLLSRLSSTSEFGIGIPWLTSHPDNEDRAQAILERAESRRVLPRRVLPQSTWEALKAAVDQNGW
jgi:predicted Zn-dependent protease